MIHKNVARTIFLYAWTPADGNPKTGDAGNISVYKAEDTGNASAITDAISEISAANMPGWYRLTHTFTGNSVAIAAKSSTAGVLVVVGGLYLNTGAIPSAAAGSNGGLPTVNANNHVAGVASAINITTEAVDAIDSKLKTVHGEGSWTTATGFAVAGDKMDLKNEAVDAIETKLKTNHGEGSWVTATGFAKPGDEMALSSQTVQAIATAVPDPMKAVVPGVYGTGTAGEANGKIKEKADKAQFDAQNRILATAEVEVAGIELTDEMIDAIWNRPRGDERPEGSFGDFLDQKVSEIKATAIVQPLTGRIQTPVGDGGELVLYQHDRVRCSWVVDEDLTGHALSLIFFDPWAPSVAVKTIPSSDITITAQTTGCLIEVDAPDTSMPQPGSYRWVIRDSTIDSTILSGAARVIGAPDVTA